MKKSYLISIFFWAVTVSLWGYISGATVAVSWLLEGAFYSVLLAAMIRLISLLRGKPSAWKEALIRGVITVSIVTCMMTVSLAAFGAYYGSQTPAFERIVLSNGDKTLVWQNVAHIGPASHYEQIAKDIAQARSVGFTIMYEGVRAGSGSLRDIDRILGMTFSPELYPTLARIANYVEQDQIGLIGGSWSLSDPRVVNVDVSVDDMLASLSGVTLPVATEVPDITPLIRDIESKLNPREKALVAYFYRGVLNFITSEMSLLRSSLPESFRRSVLDLRDEKVANYLLESSDKNFFAIYGSLHFDGVYERLQRADPKWKIITVSYFQ